MLSQTKELCAFLDASHSQYHARAYLTAILDKEGYTALKESEKWELVPGGKYYEPAVAALSWPSGCLREKPWASSSAPPTRTAPPSS